MKIQQSNLAILLLLTFLLASSYLAAPSMTLTNQIAPSPLESNNNADISPILTWTSRTQTDPLPINNGSTLVGDHVLVNATFPESMNVTYCEIRIWNVSVTVNFTSSSNSSHLVIDSYYIYHQNRTYNIQVTGKSSDNETWIIFRENVEFCNFFKPEVTVPSPQSLIIDSRTYNITWSCSDSNEEEVNYFSIWASNNDGVTYMLVAPNVTQTWYIWNSTGWLEDSYIFRIRAYSIDLTYPGLALWDPPTGYLPGDFSDGFSPSFHGNGPPPVTTTGETTSTTSVTTTTSSTTGGIILDSALILIIEGLSFSIIVVVIVLILKNRR